MTITTTSADGYVEGSFGSATAAFGSTTTLPCSTSSSSDLFMSQVFIPFDTTVLAGMTIVSARLNVYIDSHTFADIGSSLTLYSRGGGVTYPLTTGAWDPYPSGATWFNIQSWAMDDLAYDDWHEPFGPGVSIPTFALTTSDITTFMFRLYSPDIPGDTVVFRSFEYGGGFAPYLEVDVILPSGIRKTIRIAAAPRLLVQRVRR